MTRFYLDHKPEDPATEVRRIIEAAYAAGAKTIDVARFMRWDIHNALEQLRDEPLGWEILAWFPGASGLSVDRNLGDQIKHLEGVAYSAQVVWSSAIKAQLLAEMHRLLPRFPVEGAAPLVPIIHALGITEHNRSSIDYFHGDDASLYFAMFEAAMKLAAPSVSPERGQGLS